MKLRIVLLAMAGAVGLLGQQIPMTGKEVRNCCRTRPRSGG